MVFWKKKQELQPLRSEDYEELNKKIISINGAIAVIDNRLEILNGNWRKLSAKVGVLNREMSKEEGENIIKSDKVFL